MKLFIFISLSFLSVFSASLENNSFYPLTNEWIKSKRLAERTLHRKENLLHAEQEKLKSNLHHTQITEYALQQWIIKKMKATQEKVFSEINVEIPRGFLRNFTGSYSLTALDIQKKISFARIEVANCEAKISVLTSNIEELKTILQKYPGDPETLRDLKILKAEIETEKFSIRNLLFAQKSLNSLMQKKTEKEKTYEKIRAEVLESAFNQFTQKCSKNRIRKALEILMPE